MFYITSNAFYQQMYFTYLWICPKYHENYACRYTICWNTSSRQFFENEFISISKTMEFECYSDTQDQNI